MWCGGVWVVFEGFIVDGGVVWVLFGIGCGCFVGVGGRLCGILVFV